MPKHHGQRVAEFVSMRPGRGVAMLMVECFLLCTSEVQVWSQLECRMQIFSLCLLACNGHFRCSCCGLLYIAEHMHFQRSIKIKNKRPALVAFPQYLFIGKASKCRPTSEILRTKHLRRVSMMPSLIPNANDVPPSRRRQYNV